MGITGLWSLLEPVKEDIFLSECKGQRIAVDLSTWILQCALITNDSFARSAKSFLKHRGIFFRAINVSKLGINLVFVIDGPDAPPRKGKLSRQLFFLESQQYKKLLTAMGFLVVEAKGEAEKMCAELNQQKLVDGVLTCDGDALVYGAQVVYKGMFTDKKELRAAKYTMEKVNSILHMGHKDLVAFALLSKGDVSDGVNSVGEKTFLELFKEFERNGVQDILERLKSWGSNPELNELEKRMSEADRMPKKTHCSQCGHEGRKNLHCSSGCPVCETDIGCHSSLQASDKLVGTRVEHLLCPCIYCAAQREVKSHKHELKIRRLALEQNEDFPQCEVINEFLIPQNTLPELSQVHMNRPNFADIYSIVREKLHFSPGQTAEYLIPWIIKIALNGILPNVDVEPVQIIKICTENFETCYRVKWAKLADFDELSEDTGDAYEFNVALSLFESKYPDLSRQFKLQNSSSKKKRKSEQDRDSKQPKITEMFKVSKEVSGIQQASYRAAKP
ncbi:flap endonuclease gen 1 [Plakobranchus ocellatus]|uniref:Flap endonuclease gen 1 n=1 Tax=Plakobranchus ocellatus TaxID=259542 RepID=A0AAV4B790_9GAST|nr:flap endonuclease gen 1 [Plakobranchus ocellatus]